MRIEAIEIEDHILEKIEAKHGVTLDEAEETVLGPERHARRGKEGLYKVFGRTASGRYLLVVLAAKGEGVFAVATARDMTDSERRLYLRQVGG